jgi:D-hydroxyproline dehydrogenase subunit beta
MQEQRADIAVVGGGIVGLSVALAAARRGRKVVLFERNDPAVGASVRNFGLVWPIGQPIGPTHDLALRSRGIWLEIIREAGLYHDPAGSLVLAREPDEETVLSEYLHQLGEANHGRRWLKPLEISKLSPAAITTRLRGGMFSPTEVTVDPREAIRTLPRWLAERHGVKLRLGHHVSCVAEGRVRTVAEEWRVEQTFVCGGQDFESLFPEVFANSDLVRVKLQMLRTVAQPAGWRLGPALCGGLTMAHYESFRACPSLPKLRARLEAQFPFHLQHGIHLLVSQTRLGELTLGDSHHTAKTVDPFDREDIAAAIVTGIQELARFSKLEIAERWHGIYAKSPSGPWFVHRPLPGVTIVNGLGGGGMTLSFALAEKLVAAG